jgi:hypothetical protein
VINVANQSIAHDGNRPASGGAPAQQGSSPQISFASQRQAGVD